MNNILSKFAPICISIRNIRRFSVSPTLDKIYSCKLLVLGGGSAGCTMAAKFSKQLPKDSVIVLEPTTDHYYQPLWTLVGAGVLPLQASRRSQRTVLPRNALWVRDCASQIRPEENTVYTTEGHIIVYEYLIVALGLINDYQQIPGLTEALEDKNSGVSTIYSWQYCEKTWRDLQMFKGGEALFTYPCSPIKCPGAPQKIAYLADSYFNKIGVRSRTNITYYTALPVIFGVKKYADALTQVAHRKNIGVQFSSALRSLRPGAKEATFSTSSNNIVTVPYKLLHVSPPMRTPDVLYSNTELVDSNGFLDVDKYTLQHARYANIYGIGDCTNTPNSKTAAAVAKQSAVVHLNLSNTMSGDCSAITSYDGYGACPLVTSYRTCILAEFLYDGVPHETLPMDQSKESVMAFYMKKHLFPILYWNFMLKGNYDGPGTIRRLLNPSGKN